MEAIDAQLNLGCDLIRFVGSCQHCKCSGNSPWCSKGRRRQVVGRLALRCHWWAAPWKRLQAQLMGFLEFNSLTPSCSRYEPIHSFWRYTYGTDKSHGKTVRA